MTDRSPVTTQQKKIAAAALSVVASATLLLPGAGTAMAASGARTAAAATCPAETICIYKDKNFSGRVFTNPFSSGGGYANFRNIWYDGTFDSLDDSISSVINNRRGRFFLYQDADFKGDKIEMPAYTTLANMGGFNDKGSSMLIEAIPQP